MKRNSLFISNFKNPQIRKFIVTCSALLLVILLSTIAIIATFDLLSKNSVFYNELERKTDCLLNSSTRIIIAGDSRAEVQLVPLLFDDELHQATINIGLPACDLATIYNVLKSRKVLKKKITVIISTSIFQINDNIDDIGYISNALICRFSLLDKIRIFYRRPQKLFQAYLRAATSLLNKVIIRPFQGNADSLYSKDKGFRAVQGTVNITNINRITLTPDKTQHPFYKNIKLNGAKWRIFVQILDSLSKESVQVILFQPPASPAWKQYTHGSFIEDAEQQYINMLRQQVSKYGNILFFDFYNDTSRLKNGHFFDSQHLNASGAKVFSEMFIRKMQAELKDFR